MLKLAIQLLFSGHKDKLSVVTNDVDQDDYERDEEEPKQPE